MTQARNLVTAPIAPALLMFALPTLGSSVLQSANGSIDAIWVGRLLGENALAATTNGNLIMFLLTAFVFGFGMASTILHERGFAHHVIEAQLAHQERDEVSAAYNHALYLQERRPMMLWWADYLDKVRKGADVIDLQARSA